MNNFKLAIDFIFEFFANIFRVFMNHWLLGSVLILAIFSLIVGLIQLIKGSK